MYKLFQTNFEIVETDVSCLWYTEEVFRSPSEEATSTQSMDTSAIQLHRQNIRTSAYGSGLE